MFNIEHCILYFTKQAIPVVRSWQGILCGIGILGLCQHGVSLEVQTNYFHEQKAVMTCDELFL